MLVIIQEERDGISEIVIGTSTGTRFKELEEAMNKLKEDNGIKCMK